MATPTRRTSAGSVAPSKRASVSAGISAPDSSAIRVTWRRLVIGMIPGSTGMSEPRAAHPLDEVDVVGGPEEQLGHRELRTGAGLLDQHPGVVVARAGEHGCASGNAATPTLKSPASLASATSSLA